MTGYRPDSRCPGCRRSASVRFSGAEVERAKRERQSTRVVNVQCRRCGMKWWIRAREIAAATPEPGPTLPVDFPGRADLERAGIQSIAQVRAVTDLMEIPGIGRATAKRINARLDATTNDTVA